MSQCASSKLSCRNLEEPSLTEALTFPKGHQWLPFSEKVDRISSLWNMETDIGWSAFHVGRAQDDNTACVLNIC